MKAGFWVAVEALVIEQDVEVSGREPAVEQRLQVQTQADGGVGERGEGVVDLVGAGGDVVLGDGPEVATAIRRAARRLRRDRQGVDARDLAGRVVVGGRGPGHACIEAHHRVGRRVGHGVRSRVHRRVGRRRVHGDA